MALREYCNPDAILCKLEASDKRDAIEQLVDALAKAKAIPKTRAPQILEEVLQREKQASTGIGKGVGIPHARSSHVKNIAVGIARIPAGLDFQAVDGERVKVIILLISPNAKSEEHLAAMRAIVGIVRDPYHCKRLHGCESPKSFLDLIEELDGKRK